MVRHAVFMMAGTMISRILGLVREVIVAALFGATRTLDAFNVAYTLSNLARQLLAEGALSAAFVPVFSQSLTKGREKALSAGSGRGSFRFRPDGTGFCGCTGYGRTAGSGSSDPHER